MIQGPWRRWDKGHGILLENLKEKKNLCFVGWWYEPGLSYENYCIIVHFENLRINHLYCLLPMQEKLLRIIFTVSFSKTNFSKEIVYLTWLSACFFLYNN